jgi:peptidoglycan/LPS O-acetylase OafA/YrhL
VGIGLLGPHLALMNDTLIKFTPDLALLFAIGVLTSGILTASERVRSRPWAWYALAASSPVVALIIVKGTTSTNLNLFWVDLAWGPTIACPVAAVATSRPGPSCASWTPVRCAASDRSPTACT